jgi:RNA polymerase sigma factor (sigma-70 family)
MRGRGSFPEIPIAVLMVPAHGYLSCSRARYVASACAAGGAAQSDDGRAVEELLRRYEPLVRAVVARVRPPYGCDRDELAQDARLGLLGAIRSWQPDRGPFGAFAARRARARVLNALDRAGARKHQVLSRAVSLDRSSRSTSTADLGDEMRAPLYDLIASTSRLDQPVAGLLAREELDRVLAALPALTARERAALTGVLNGNQPAPRPRRQTVRQTRTARRSSDRRSNQVDGQQVRQAAGELVGHQHPVIRCRRGRSGQRDRRQPSMVEQHRRLRIDLAREQRASVLERPLDPHLDLVADVARVRLQRPVRETQRPRPPAW